MLSRLQGDHFLKSNRGKRITKLVFGNQFWRLPRNNRVVKHIFLRLFVLFWDLSCENEMPNSMTNTVICIYHEPRPGRKCQDQNWFPDRFRECCMRDCSKQWRYQILTASSSRCFRTAPNVERWTRHLLTDLVCTVCRLYWPQHDGSILNSSEVNFFVCVDFANLQTWPCNR